MRVLHIVQGGISNGDKAWLEKAAVKNLKPVVWVVPKSAVPGDEVVVYIAGYGFFATGIIDSLPQPSQDWPNRYGAKITNIHLIVPSISLDAIRGHIPELNWANYPRSITTPDAAIAAKVRRLITERHKRGLSDLDDHALSEVNIDELRRAALMKAQKSATVKERKALFRARSVAIKLYVLRRSNGICEGCKEPAPFNRADGSPYLEPHHTRKLSDDGPDHPKYVIALCPNCHRKAHYAADAQSFNSRLIEALMVLEPNEQ